MAITTTPQFTKDERACAKIMKIVFESTLREMESNSINTYGDVKQSYKKLQQCKNASESISHGKIEQSLSEIRYIFKRIEHSEQYNLKTFLFHEDRDLICTLIEEIVLHLAKIVKDTT